MLHNEIGRERLIKVYRYLQALHQHRNPVKRQINQERWVLWFRDLPEHAAVIKGNLWPTNGPETDTNFSADDFILKVRRPKLTMAPEPPEVLLEWLEPGWEDPESEVKVKATKSRSENDQPVLEEFITDIERIDLLNNWNRTRNEWAAKERPARNAMKVFERFYDLYGWHQKESERIEIIIGDGILSWQREDGHIHHPVLLVKVQLDFNPGIPEFIISETDSEVQIDSALFRAIPDIDGRMIAGFHAELGGGMYHPLGGSVTSEYLKQLVNHLSPRGEFLESLSPENQSREPRIGRSPVLFVRDRFQGFGLAIEAILEDLKERPELPEHLLNIVGVESGVEKEEIEPIPEDSWSEPEDILLGKPANPEQISIARSIEQHHGVLVQGPPGTGKTHTIANLIGHFLSQGKSVLVTSHTTKALRVLRDQVVPELRPLCVSVLDSDSAGRQQLEESIEGIVNRLSTANPTDLKTKATNLAAQRKEIIEALKTTRQELVEARSTEYQELNISSERYIPAEAARKVAREFGLNDWIPKPVTAGSILPLSDIELNELYQTNISLTPEDEAELAYTIPTPSDLLQPEDFKRFLDEMQVFSNLKPEFRSELWDEAEIKYTSVDLESLAARINKAVSYISQEESWKNAALYAGYKGGEYRRPWDSLIELIEKTMEFSASCKENLLHHQPELTGLDTLENQLLTVTSIISELEKGVKTKLTKVERIIHPAWAKLIKNVKVKGKEPVNIEHFRAVADLLRLKILRRELSDRWDLQVASGGAPIAAELGAEPETAAWQFSKIITNCLEWYQQSWKPLEAVLKSYGFNWEFFLAEYPPNLKPSGEIIRLKEAASGSLQTILRAKADYLHYDEFNEQFKKVEYKLINFGTNCSKVAADLLKAVQSLDVTAYELAFQQLLVLSNKRINWERRNSLLKILEDQAPNWAKEIRLRKGLHGQETVPGNIIAAWRWRQLNDELDRRGQVSLIELQQKIEGLSSDLRSVTSQLIEVRAWEAQLKRTRINERMSLVGYLDIMKKIGRGKGKRAPRLRVEARRKMAECRRAVPVWIMPLAGVAENFNPGDTRFDVVIIDEASQCDVMGLIALYPAEKVIIVGDHEQVSPLAIGQKIEVVEHLIAEHLQSIPNSVLYDGQMSVYDLARASFGSTICLLEHFRCMPEIIGFSNQLSYRGRIKALRDTSKVRIKPALVPYHVSGAVSDEKINLIEARTVASIILSLLEQPEYQEKTIGVISLLGDDQAWEIDKILRRHISENEYAKRKIVCGNAAHFQGDERDVMFLSMVYGPSANPPMKMLDSGYQGLYQKRFNVAASRAKDQLWVVYSVNPGVDLKPGDLRRRLIEYAEAPLLEVNRLDKESLSQTTLEKEVQKILLQTGYQVIPKWQVGYHTIDLVVDGGGRRLAIECDGDRIHSLGKISEDISRQALLERLGWTFIRIRGSQFFRDPESTMNPIFDRLDELEIYPENLKNLKNLKNLDNDSYDILNQEGSRLKEEIIRRADRIHSELLDTNKIFRVENRFKEEADSPINNVSSEKATVNICDGKEKETQPVSSSKADNEVKKEIISPTNPKSNVFPINTAKKELVKKEEATDDKGKIAQSSIAGNSFPEEMEAEVPKNNEKETKIVSHLSNVMSFLKKLDKVFPEE